MPKNISQKNPTPIHKVGFFLSVFCMAFSFNLCVGSTSASAACVNTAQAATIAATIQPTAEGETPTVTTLATCGGDDISYQVPITTSITYDGVQFNSVYATTNSVITFGRPDGTYWDYPVTPSISIVSMDWVVYPNQRNDEHLIISSSDGGFQVDISARPIFLQSAPETTNIVITAAINTDGTVALSYLLSGADYSNYNWTRTGARLNNGTVVPLEQANIQRVEEAPVLTPEPVTPSPEPTVEPTPSPTPSPEPSATPQPSSTPTPVVEPSPTPTPEPSPTQSATPTQSPSPSPSPSPSTEPSPEPSPTQSPVVESSPTPSPSAIPEPLPTPTPTVNPEPEPSPSPTPVVPSEPTPSPTPSVEPNPIELPQPNIPPAPEPAVPPALEPEPIPQPEPPQIVEPEPPAPVEEPSPEPPANPEEPPVPADPAPNPDDSQIPPVPVDENTTPPSTEEPEPPIAIPDPVEPPPAEALNDALDDGKISAADIEVVVDSLMADGKVTEDEATALIETLSDSGPLSKAEEKLIIAALSADGEVTQSEVNNLSETLASDGKFTNAEKELVAEALIESADGQAVTAEAIAEAGIDYADLPESQPVEVRTDENGNEVIITAVVADALELLASPAEMLSAIFESPAQLIFALGNLGADMSVAEREEATKTVVAATIVGNIAATTVAASAVGAAGYRRQI
jgi:polyhydroxyalkanoate synthesis regulator phasin